MLSHELHTRVSCRSHFVQVMRTFRGAEFRQLSSCFFCSRSPRIVYLVPSPCIRVALAASQSYVVSRFEGFSFKFARAHLARWDATTRHVRGRSGAPSTLPSDPPPPTPHPTTTATLFEVPNKLHLLGLFLLVHIHVLGNSFPHVTTFQFCIS